MTSNPFASLSSLPPISAPRKVTVQLATVASVRQARRGLDLRPLPSLAAYLNGSLRPGMPFTTRPGSPV